MKQPSQQDFQQSVHEHWQVRKSAVSGHDGLVASQHHLASEIGADVLRRGGNAVDAAIATGLAIGTVEPWMSGIGGGGYMTVYLAATDEVKVVEFGMRAPFESRPEDYPLAGGETGADTFNWPAVKDEANVHGPLSIAVPGYIRGMALARDQYGTMDWCDLIDPACRLAEWGLPVDWYSSMKFNHFSRGLARYDETRRIYLADGLPPVPELDGSIKTLRLGKLAETYRTLQREGPGAYYEGPLAESIAKDLASVGSRISTDDLAAYEARIGEPLSTQYRDSTVYVAGDLTAGPSLIQALEFLSDQLTQGGAKPDAAAYHAIAQSLLDAYEYRLEHLGEGSTSEAEQQNPGNTTHICVADAEGNVVSLTQTIMSGFGSRIMLPGTGILMNNGMMWFDPRPGGPNSVVGGRHPLCNMCPVITRQADGSLFAVGACGGRKIFPAVFHLISFMVDYGMTPDQAVHQPRLDVSGTDLVTLMNSLPRRTLESLQLAHPHSVVRPNGVSPNFFALPQLVQRRRDGSMSGGCFIPSPHARVVSA